MTLGELAEGLPWGLHDAYLEALSIDWTRATASLTMRLMMSERQDQERRARIDLSGLVFCSLEPPEIDPERGYAPTPPEGLWLSDGEGAAPGAAAVLPAISRRLLPALVVRQQLESVHSRVRERCVADVVGRGTRRARANTRTHFPGDEIPDP